MTPPAEQRPTLWEAVDAAAATGGRAGGDWAANGVSIDSRTVEPGELFIAIAGPTNDGHDFVADALTKGAAAAVVSRDIRDVEPGRLLKVKNTDDALRGLAIAARARSKARICAITGSVGKTGTKEMLAAALAKSGKVTATAGNLNNHWGLPLSLARMPADADFGVFEIGMNHAGEISPLSKLARPDVVMITAVEAVHLEFFKDVEAIADAKAEIFDGLVADGTAVLNRDSPHFDRLLEKARAAGAKTIWSFGVHSFSNARLVSYTPQPAGGLVQATVGGRHLRYTLGISGRHWALNSIAVVAAAQALGADLDFAIQAFVEMTPGKGRGQQIEVALKSGKLTVIDETYNASAASIRAALEVLATQKPGRGGRRIVVLGDMLELGERAQEIHLELADDIVAHDADMVFACGQYMPAILDHIPEDMQGATAPSSAELAPMVADAVRGGDLVLVKGSNGSRMGVVVDTLVALGAAEKE